MRFHLLILSLFIGIACFTQPIPIDSMFLGQIPPDEIPKKFNLFASPTFATVERIAISNDGKMICYHENNGYNKSSINRIRFSSYIYNKWTSPETLFEGFTAPAFSVTNDTLFMEKTSHLWYSTKDNNTWTKPVKFDTRISYWHYFQISNSGVLYASLVSHNNRGIKEWSSIHINNQDTIIRSLGAPVNSINDNLDFYISKDESYIIFASDRADLIKYGYYDLFISFRKEDKSWTIPQNLGQDINIKGEVRWGPYVSPDKMYLFYSRSSTQDNSDACTYWVRIDNLVNRLKNNVICVYEVSKMLNR